VRGKQTAFTLAEVLFTLAIVGVVAAMTLPALINKTQDKQFKTAFKKQYSTFAQAMQRVYAEDGSTYEHVEWIQMPKFFCSIQKAQKVLKSGIDCSKVQNDNYSGTDEWPATGGEYWHKNGEWFDKQGNPQTLNSGYWPMSYLLPDGALVVYNCSNQIFVDVNGYKKPNTIGKDIFFFVVVSKNMVPTIIPKSNSIRPNACTISGSNTTPILTPDNYKDDCLNGTGLGCSLLYLTD